VKAFTNPCGLAQACPNNVPFKLGIYTILRLTHIISTVCKVVTELVQLQVLHIQLTIKGCRAPQEWGGDHDSVPGNADLERVSSLPDLAKGLANHTL